MQMKVSAYNANAFALTFALHNAQANAAKAKESASNRTGSPQTRFVIRGQFCADIEQHIFVGKAPQQLTAVWQKWRFSAPQTHLWLIKH